MTDMPNNPTVFKLNTCISKRKVSINSVINYVITTVYFTFSSLGICNNPLNAELNPMCPLLALFGAHHILHVSR